jgi:hypothetical protein
MSFADFMLLLVKLRKNALTRQLIRIFFARAHANRERHELCTERKGRPVEVKILSQITSLDSYASLFSIKTLSMEIKFAFLLIFTKSGKNL